MWPRKAVKKKSPTPKSEMSILQANVDTLKVLAAQPLIQNLHAHEAPRPLGETEFKVFSQFGDDGIIQYLIHQLHPLPDSFVEFGVEDYRESNTRFLLVNNNWRGLVLDGDKDCIRSIQTDEISWRHTLIARQAFVDRDNINVLLRQTGFVGDIGLLSIDIDGNDYWVWDKIDIVRPIVVIVEYNSIFGPDLAVTIPYDARFNRHRAHYSGQFWGASLTALTLLANQKRYSLVGCNSAGNNAYFVRHDKIDKVPVLSVHEAFVDARFRDSRNQKGDLTFRTGHERLAEIATLNVHDLHQNKLVRLDSLISP